MLKLTKLAYIGQKKNKYVNTLAEPEKISRKNINLCNMIIEKYSIKWILTQALPSVHINIHFGFDFG